MKKQWIIACLIGIQGVNVQAQQPSKYPYQDTKLTAEPTGGRFTSTPHIRRKSGVDAKQLTGYSPAWH